jgi:hypothetical protein
MKVLTLLTVLFVLSAFTAAFCIGALIISEATKNIMDR